jgi:hypothetical protein
MHEDGDVVKITEFRRPGHSLEGVKADGQPLVFYSIQEKDFLTNALKQPGPIQSVDCRAPESLPVYWQT